MTDGEQRRAEGVRRLSGRIFDVRTARADDFKPWILANGGAVTYNALALLSINCSGSLIEAHTAAGGRGFDALNFSGDPEGETIYCAIMALAHEAFYATDETRMAAAEAILTAVPKPDLSTFRAALAALLDD